jgi:hypothetical protein
MNGRSRGVFVEVTSTSIKKSASKDSQRKAMENAGLPYTVLSGENLMKISKHINEESLKNN